MWSLTVVVVVVEEEALVQVPVEVQLVEVKEG